MCLFYSKKYKLHVDFKLHFPISAFIQSHFLRVQSLLLQGRKDGWKAQILFQQSHRKTVSDPDNESDL